MDNATTIHYGLPAEARLKIRRQATALPCIAMARRASGDLDACPQDPSGIMRVRKASGPSRLGYASLPVHPLMPQRTTRGCRPRGARACWHGRAQSTFPSQDWTPDLKRTPPVLATEP